MVPQIRGGLRSCGVAGVKLLDVLPRSYMVIYHPGPLVIELIIACCCLFPFVVVCCCHDTAADIAGALDLVFCIIENKRAVFRWYKHIT